MMTREDALDSISVNVENANLRKHMFATEAIMRELAKRLGEDEETWGITGLLHDIDVELTADDKAQHSRLGADLAQELGASHEMVQAILKHNEAHGLKPVTKLEKALISADPLTGLITAAALVLPGKKLAKLEATSVVKRYKEKGFAAGANRELISRCSELGLSLEEFIALGLKAMQGVADELGL